MRVHILGDNGTARGLRGLLQSTGRYVLGAEGALYTVKIEEALVPQVVIDGVDCVFERYVVGDIATLLPSGRVELQRGGGNQDDRCLVLRVPLYQPLVSVAVERGVFRALERASQQPEPADVPSQTMKQEAVRTTPAPAVLAPATKKPWWKFWAAAILIATTATHARAQFFETSVRRIMEDGTALPARTTVNFIGAGITCVDNPGSNRLDCTVTGGGGGGAPTDATYWVGAAHAGLSAEHNLAGLSTGLVLNTTGTPSAYGGTSCTNQFPRSLNGSGAATCASVALGSDVSGDLPTSRLNGGTGATSSTYWRGDGVWASLSFAPTTPQYWVATADATLSAERDLGALTTGLVLNTVTAGVGVPSTYAGASCTNQFPRALSASGAPTCASVALNADVTSTLPVSNGGTGAAPGGADQVLVATSASAATWRTLPSCSNGTTSKLLYDNATDTFSCGTDQGGAGSGLDHPAVMSRASLGF